jgi:hypothetical protein
VHSKNQSKAEKENVQHAEIVVNAKENAHAKLPVENANDPLEKNEHANTDRVDEENLKNNSSLTIKLLF